MRTGLVIGKFMPPHLGHDYLVRTARGACESLDVVVCSLDSEPIPGALRHRWVRERFGAVARVLHLGERMPQEPGDSPTFWEEWRAALLRTTGRSADRVFASERYGVPLARCLGAEFVPVDLEREMMPISATELRREPARHWRYLIPEARPHFIRRVAVVGPESTGKTRLCRQLSSRLGMPWLHEYARAWLDVHGPEPREVDLHTFAEIRRSAEAALATQSASPVMLVDTDSLTTVYWSRRLFGHCDPRIEAMAREERYELTLLMGDDCPFVPDRQRYGGGNRQSATAEFAALLAEFGRASVKITARRWPDRETEAIGAIHAAFQGLAVGWYG